MSNETKVIRVGAGTPPKELAKSIAATYTKEGKGEVKLRSVGAGAVNQMMKGLIISKSLLQQRNISIEFDAFFSNVEKKSVFPDAKEHEKEEFVTAIDICIKFTEQ
jgi:stage V sporulation protein SpoVS